MKKAIIILIIMMSCAVLKAQQVKNKNIKGTVIFYDTTKGIGFIKTIEGVKVCVLYTDLPFKNNRFVTLQAKQELRFDIIDTKQGARAVNITIL